MKCTACGNDNQPTAKFCVHCGVLLSPVSAPFAASSVGSGTVSMPAAPRPAAPASAPPPPPQPQSFTPQPAPMSPGAIPVTGAPESVPASSSTRTGLIIGAVAALIVIAAGFVGYRALYGGSSKPSVAVSEPPKAIQPAAAPAPEPVKEATPVAASTGEPAPAATPAPPEEQPKTAAAEQGALPGTAATPPKPRSAPSKAATKAEPSSAQPAPAPPAPAKAPAKATTVAAAPATVVQPDHWQMYADAMGRCAREDFFKRLGCELRTRNQYCQGFWGTVPQCPEATPRDRGQ